jgi:predicted metal-dependent hydrolase
MEIKIIRSNKRAKTVTARVVGNTLEILSPAHCSDAELQPIIDKLRLRIERKQQQRNLNDTDLEQIARRLNREYFQNSLQWHSIEWSTQQTRIYGSCTPALGTIRISQRLAKMPLFVQEYVVMHELSHLIEANHSANFWQLANRYPLTERARGYLMAVGLEELD